MWLGRDGSKLVSKRAVFETSLFFPASAKIEGLYLSKGEIEMNISARNILKGTVKDCTAPKNLDTK